MDFWGVRKAPLVLLAVMQFRIPLLPVAECAEQPDDFDRLLAESIAASDQEDSESAPTSREEQSDDSETYFLCSPCGRTVAVCPPDLLTEECSFPARGLLGGAD